LLLFRGLQMHYFSLFQIHVPIKYQIG